MPDVIIWMIASEKRIAYFRIPAYDILYSDNQLYRGRYCGLVRTLMLKVKHYLIYLLFILCAGYKLTLKLYIRIHLWTKMTCQINGGFLLKFV